MCIFWQNVFFLLLLNITTIEVIVISKGDENPYSLGVSIIMVLLFKASLSLNWFHF